MAGQALHVNLDSPQMELRPSVVKQEVQKLVAIVDNNSSPPLVEMTPKVEEDGTVKVKYEDFDIDFDNTNNEDHIVFRDKMAGKFSADACFKNSICDVTEEAKYLKADGNNGIIQSVIILRDMEGNILNKQNMKPCFVVISRMPLLEKMAAEKAFVAEGYTKQSSITVDKKLTDPPMEVKQEPNQAMTNADDNPMSQMIPKKEQDDGIKVEYDDFEMDFNDIKIEDHTDRDLAASYRKNRTKKYPGLKTFQCDQCDSCFALKSSLSVHLVLHSDLRPFECDQCGNCFKRKGGLRTHLTTHSGARPFKCQICGHCFKLKGSLRRHSLTHSRAKPLKCDICSRCFKLNSSLRRHLLTHSGVRQFKCDQCDRCFSLKCNLRAHLLTHSALKPFKCDICGHCFIRKNSWNMHLLAHSGIRQFKCDQCGKCFSQNRYLNKHLLTHSALKLRQKK